MTAMTETAPSRYAEKLAEIAKADWTFTTHEETYDDGIEVKVGIRYKLVGYANELPDGRWQITVYKTDKGYRPAGITASKDAAIVRIAEYANRAK